MWGLSAIRTVMSGVTCRSTKYKPIIVNIHVYWIYTIHSPSCFQHQWYQGSHVWSVEDHLPWSHHYRYCNFPLHRHPHRGAQMILRSERSWAGNKITHIQQSKTIKCQCLQIQAQCYGHLLFRHLPHMDFCCKWPLCSLHLYMDSYIGSRMERGIPYPGLKWWEIAILVVACFTYYLHTGLSCSIRITFPSSVAKSEKWNQALLLVLCTEHTFCQFHAVTMRKLHMCKPYA